MATDKKGNLFYEVTREKPGGKSNLLLLGGSISAVISFFCVSILGSIFGVEMDDLIFYFIISSIVGFLAGGVLTWFVVYYIPNKTNSPSPKSNDENQEFQPVASNNTEPIIPAEEAEKGQSVDYVFPEISPDK